MDWGSRDFIRADELGAWTRPYDLKVLDRAKHGSFNVLHVCKRHNLLLDFADYPVHAFSWAATDPTNPTLRQVLDHSPRAVMGGIDHETALLADDPSQVLAQLRRGFEETGGRRWLVAPGCSIAPATPPGNLRALRDAVENIMSHGTAP